MANISADTGARLTGGKVALMFGGFFGVIFVVNGVMAFDAISTFRGEVSDHPYEEGVTYNRTLAAAQAQSDRHWKVDVALANGITATFHDGEGRPIEGLAVSGVFEAPADRKRDHAFTLTETGPGVYALESSAPSGLWELTLQAQSGGEAMFKTRNRVTVP